MTLIIQGTGPHAQGDFARQHLAFDLGKAVVESLEVHAGDGFIPTLRLVDDGSANKWFFQGAGTGLFILKWRRIMKTDHR